MVVVTLQKNAGILRKRKAMDTRRCILDFLCSQGLSDRITMAQALGVNNRIIEANLKRLVDRGYAVEVQHGGGGRYLRSLFKATPAGWASLYGDVGWGASHG